MPVVPPPAFALGAAVLQHRLAPRRSTGLGRNLAAGAVATGSVALLTGATKRFRDNHTTFEPFDPSKATTLVTDGPNALTRNPMYVGMAGLLTAHALLRGGVLTALPVAGFVAVIDRFQIRPEEESLRRLFGQEYDDYCAAVPRWLSLSR